MGCTLQNVLYSHKLVLRTEACDRRTHQSAAELKFSVPIFYARSLFQPTSKTIVLNISNITASGGKFLGGTFLKLHLALNRVLYTMAGVKTPL